MKFLLLLFLALTPSGSSVFAGPFRFASADKQSLGLWENSRLVFVYNHGVISPTNAPADRARSSYLHPIYGLDGEVLTDDFPKDHYHHHGLFWAWPHVRVGDEEFDLWLGKGIRQQFEHWLRRDAGKDAAILGVKNGWFVGKRKILEEQVWFRVTPTTMDGRAIDVEIILKPVKQAVTLRGAEGKGYGGLTLRFAPRLGDTIITAPEGRTTNDLLMARLPWTDLSGSFAGAPGPGGAAIFVPPWHPSFPLEWMTRHYGVLCVGWPGVAAQTIPPGKSVRCSYRLWIHRAIPEASQLQQQYDHYARRNINAPPISLQSTRRPQP